MSDQTAREWLSGYVTGTEEDAAGDHGLDDPRYRPFREAITAIGERLRKRREERAGVVDLTPWFLAVQDQGPVPSCTAHAATALLEYCQMRASDVRGRVRERLSDLRAGRRAPGARGADASTTMARAVNVSARFLYKVSLSTQYHFEDLWGDIPVDRVRGLPLRKAFGAMVKFGVPPEKYWPYPAVTGAEGEPRAPEEIAEELGREPPPMLYALARNYRAGHYARLDPVRKEAKSAEQILEQAKACLRAGIPSAAAIPIWQHTREHWVQHGEFPLPDLERIPGDNMCYHAIVLVGYSPDKVVGDARPGAFLIRNSWLLATAEDLAADHPPGYGWLPEEYALLTESLTPATLTGHRFATMSPMLGDWWVLLSADWVEPGGFAEGLGTRPGA